jgi:N-acetylglucosaminyldiphosphoundecaprenol N-acetyl-beta-D-mannosaminyltransferase
MTVELMGINIDNYNFEDAVKKGLDFISGNKVSQVVTINPEMFKEAENNDDFKKILDEAELVIPDGVGVKIALKMKGYSAERIAGIDFAYRLLEECAKMNYPVAIVGSKEDVVVKAAENLKAKLLGLNIVYCHNGYFEDNAEIYNDIKKANPKLVLVALGSPKQEFFIYNAKQVLSPCLMVGIGGSLDVWSGTVKRAPVFWQKMGLEWFYRTVTQPQRFKRIFPTLPLFLLKVIMYKKG